jgi:glycosyltransferase involved in cell wall biosynthesis
MRVAVLAPIAWRTPPADYGPWEQVASLLTEGLVRAGVEVTLFATGDSRTSARLVSVAPRGYEVDRDLDGRVWEALHVSHALGRAADFDLVHNHLDWLPLAFAEHWPVPLLTTIHGFSGPGILPAYQRAGGPYVSISDADRSPQLPYVATVHHGVDPDQLPFSAAGGDDLVCLGRIHPDKGTAEAIDIAQRAGRRLLICGIVHDTSYFRERVLPKVDGERVVYLGSVGPRERAEVLGRSAVLIHPVAFDEPFGLAVVEAMMCGTPVVAFDRGAMPEVVDEGVTGYVVSDTDAAVAAVDRAVALDRAVCHDIAAKRFSAQRMVHDYLEVYERVLSAAST